MFRWPLFGIALLAGCCAWVVAAPAPMDPPQGPRKMPLPCFGLLVASVQAGDVYTITNGSLGEIITPRLWQASLRPNSDTKEGNSFVFREWLYGEMLDRLHWRIAHGHIWAECGFLSSLRLSSGHSNWHRIPMQDLPLLNAQNEKGASQLRKKYGNDDAATVGWFSTNLLAPLSEVIDPILLGPGIGLGTGSELWDMEGDFLPTGPDTWDLFLLHKSQLSMWYCFEKPERDGLGIRSAEGKKRGEAIDAGFQEPFFVYGKPEAPFFVTRSGKVFQCLRPKGKEPRVVKVWDDPKRQVRTILNDADTNRTFVAGPDPAEGEGQWFYFELTEKPEKKPFDRSAVTAHAQEPLQSALLFARFLVKEGMLKTPR